MSRLQGRQSAEALFNTLPEAVRREGERMIVELSNDVLAAQREDVAVKTGFLKSKLGIDAQLAEFRARIGLVTRGASNAWYGRIIEGGRRAQTVKVKRRRNRRNGTASVSAYTMNVSALPARPFINAARPDLDGKIDRRTADFWSRVLADVGAAG